MRENLALIAGVPMDDVTLDTTRRRAMVIAKPLPGASLASYYALEQRVGAGAKNWTIKLQPPAVALPELTISDGALSEVSIRNLDLIIWASERLNLPLAMTGGVADMAVAKQALAARNVAVTEQFNAAVPSGAVRLRWLSPTENIGAQ